MKRRLVLATCLLGIVGGTAGAALASSPSVSSRNHNVCIVLANNENYNNTQYYCITTP
jgi:pyruvate/2-oxoacid:ferredoxin oxidoreductase beta subunit